MSSNSEMRALTKRLKAAQAALKLAKARGQVNETFTAPEVEDEEDRKVPWQERRPNGPNFGPLFKLLEQLRALPREALEARYSREFNEPAPALAARWWLVEKIGRKHQDELWHAFQGYLPDSLTRTNARFARMKPPKLAPEMLALAEPSERDLRFDDSSRVRAVGDNPFARGKAWEMFEVVALSGDRGVGYRELVIKLERALGFDKPRAEKRARKMFTKWVNRGWTRIA